MSELKIETENGKTQYLPGEPIAGSIQWNFIEQPKSVDLRLIWYTRGKGTQDVGIVDSLTFDNPAQYETRQFSFDPPPGPYSFSGSLIALIWALEAVARPGDQSERLKITISPTGAEINIASTNHDDNS